MEVVAGEVFFTPAKHRTQQSKVVFFSNFQRLILFSFNFVFWLGEQGKPIYDINYYIKIKKLFRAFQKIDKNYKPMFNEKEHTSLFDSYEPETIQNISNLNQTDVNVRLDEVDSGFISNPISPITNPISRIEILPNSTETNQIDNI